MKNISLALFLIMFSFAYSQETKDPVELFNEGKFFYQREDYKEALYFFKQLVAQFPENSNYHFKVGECYLNIAGQEHLAIRHLEIAIKKIVPKKDYKGNNYNENDAPLHALFYLGNAYRVDGQIDEALKMYNKFMDSPYFYNNYNINIVENEIRSCERAKIIQDTPVDIEHKKLGDQINSEEFSEFNAILSKDGKTIVFIRGLKFYDAIYYSRFVEGNWQDPVNINQDIVSDGDYYPTGLSNDGTKLLLIREVDQNPDIYMSKLIDGSWTPAKKLNGKINSLAGETFADFGEEDNIIYLVSNRQGSKGMKDIFVSKLDKKGLWGKPKNIGKDINTALDEDTPAICDNGRTIFFSSKSHYNMGGYDIFYSFNEDGKWSVPRNIGYPQNTTRDNLFFIVDETCKTAMYSIIDPDSGLSDIYGVNIKEPLALPE